MPPTLPSSMPVTKSKILLLAANPQDTVPLQLDEEVRAIDAALTQSRLRDQLELVSHWAVRVEDITALILRHRPTFIHFSGHGSRAGRILLADAAGLSVEVDGPAFAQLMEAAGISVRGIFLNACYSEAQAALLAPHIPAVVGVAGAILDEAAMTFARTFYLALGAGETIENAYRIGCADVALTWPDELQQIHLFGEQAGVDFCITSSDSPIQAQTEHASKKTTIFNDNVIKGFVQENPGTISMIFNDAPDRSIDSTISDPTGDPTNHD